MPDSTSRYSLPFPLLRGDSPNGAQEIQDLATATEAALGVVDDRTVTLPAGDSSTNSKILTGADLRCTQSATTNILTSSFTLTHSQVVEIAAKARFEADATSASQGDVGISITIDGVVGGGSALRGVAQAGPVHIDASGSTSATRAQLAIPTFSILLAAGSHTVILQADRNTTGVINASADSSITSRTPYNPTTLTVTV